jgi:hypothetical protein
MKKIIVSLFASIALVTLLTTNVWALSFQVDFTATNFSIIGGSTPGPYSLVSGSFGFEAASINSHIDSLTSVDLTIGGFSYDLDDIDTTTLGSSVIVGGIGSGLNSINWTTDDFWFLWDINTLAPTKFAYTAASGFDGAWGSTQFDSFSITAASFPEPSFDSFSITAAAPVPEPSTILLLGGGLAGLAFYSRRRKKNKHTKSP